MSKISVNNLTFYYDGSYDNIFEDVSFWIDTEWRLGFIGRNGRGKTTFLKLLLNKYEYRGSISSSVMFDYFPYEINDKQKNTIDILDEIDPQNEFWKVCRELSLLKMEEDIWHRPFSSLSNGEQTKVMLAILFSKDNNFLLIDEPTNHLDMETRQVVQDYLKQKKGFVLVSHDRSFLDGCIDHVLSINKTNIEVVQGNFTTWWDNKKRQDEFELAENEKHKKEIKRLTSAARQSSQWADKVESDKIGHKDDKYEKSIDRRAYLGEKSRRLQMRRKNLERRQQTEISEKAQLLKNIESADGVKIIPLKHHKDKVIEAVNLSLFYGDKQVCGPISFDINNGECIVLTGKNGTGKSSILKKILGEEIKAKGSIEASSSLIISYVSQDTSWLNGNLKEFAKKYHIEESLFKQFLRKMDFSRQQFDKNIEEFSEGQKKKVLIAKSLSEQAHLYIWDEPLNFIDIFSRMQIEELIMKYRPTMLLVEHDRAFVEAISGRIVHL